MLHTHITYTQCWSSELELLASWSAHESGGVVYDLAINPAESGIQS